MQKKLYQQHLCKTHEVYLESVYKVRFFVIPAEAGIQNLLKILDSGLRTAGMTESTR
jgi:hypothetical protein